VKAFLVSTPTEPNCMNCHHAWNREFLDAHLSRSWREGELKEHRAKLLFDRERSMLPATQIDVETELQKRTYATELTALNEKFTILKARLAKVQKDMANRQYFIRNGVHLQVDVGDGEMQEKKEKRQFIAACPIEACRGFMSTAYKCGTCQTQFCPSCREVRPDKEGHTCDPALVATIAAIVKDSRPCPSCGMAISKVSGCDQMYCTACDTAYSYETGKVVTGVIHNPHYFERMKALHGAVPRQPGDAGHCGMQPFYTLPSAIRNNDLLRKLYQTARHTEQVSLPEFPTVAVPTNNTDLRVRYLLKELDEKRFKQLIQQRDRKRQRELEIRGCLELFVIIVMEFFHKPSIAAEKIKELTDQIDTLVNAPLRAIGERYGNRILQIDMATGEYK